MDPYLLCDPSDKTALEIDNALAQLEYIEHLVHDRRITDLRTSHVRELKRIATDRIYPCGDAYRDAFRQVRIEGSRHELPHESLVLSLVDEMIDKLNADRERHGAVERAAYAIWRINWIHPFPGGNGRTARALGYLILCLDLGRVPGGTPQFPTLLYDAAAAYTRALRHADAGAKQGIPDLKPMIALVNDAITRQLQGLIERNVPSKPWDQS
ncbi:MAG: hypothetical protein ETSY1_40640 [Candidatus Entotheonella factor]|uniref:Fido domain-containing protein n=1 Tax=Entotheonella factor TaxID=1429438 RepID=W4L6X6_ENTF1|nr:Fic family protein [Candidatus Entotheonella palauensis]ETW93111.1 MAG: hypothetical protein ETSY1_40640 [Candidatus Entotheonella factor]